AWVSKPGGALGPVLARTFRRWPARTPTSCTPGERLTDCIDLSPCSLSMVRPGASSKGTPRAGRPLADDQSASSGGIGCAGCGLDPAASADAPHHVAGLLPVELSIGLCDGRRAVAEDDPRDVEAELLPEPGGGRVPELVGMPPMAPVPLLQLDLLLGGPLL